MQRLGNPTDACTSSRSPFRLTFSQKFLKEGCPNCEGFLSLAHSQEAVEECTSQVYEGLIALADPAQSWVAKWQRLDGYVKGVYAVKVMGTVRPLSDVEIFLKMNDPKRRRDFFAIFGGVAVANLFFYPSACLSCRRRSWTPWLRITSTIPRRLPR
jgi:hypothetical protein